MKTTARVMAVVLAMATVGLAEPEKPGDWPLKADGDPKDGDLKKVDRGLYVIPDVGDLDLGEQVNPDKDQMLAKLMDEMLQAMEEDRKTMEAPVEFPKLDASDLWRLIDGSGVGETTFVKRGTIGMIINERGGKGLVVEKVEEASAAEAAGLRAGDVLLDVNGILLRDVKMLADLLQVVRGQELSLGVRRRGEVMKVAITPQELEVPGSMAPTPDVSKVEARRLQPVDADRDDDVLGELRGMRGLMEEMLQELKKQSPKVRRVPTPTRN